MEADTKRVSKASVSEARVDGTGREETRVRELVSKVSSQAELEAAQTNLASMQSRFELANAQMAQKERLWILQKHALPTPKFQALNPDL